MKTMLILILLNFSYAQTLKSPPISKREVWRLGNKFYPMERVDGVLMSFGCSYKKEKCEARKVFNQKNRYEMTEKDLQGGKSPGAVVCKNFLKSEVLILKDAKENENAFCLFKDGSLITASALY